MRSTNKIFRFIFVIIVNLAILLSLILVMEYGSSFFVSKPGRNITSNPRVNHTWKPGTDNTHREWISKNPDFPEPYVHYYNRQGWLEKYDVGKQKPKGTYRVFYVGDSFTEGTSPMDQSVPSTVEKKLNELSTDKNLVFEVVNTGTTSYAPTIYYLLVRYVIAEYSPDLIVVNVDMTDDFDDWKYSETLIRDEEGNPLYAPRRDIFESMYLDTEQGTIKANFWTRASLYLALNSYTYNFVLQNMKKVFGNDFNSPTYRLEEGSESGYQRWAWCKREWDDLTRSRVGTTLDFLRRLAIWSQQHGIKVMFTGVPHFWQYAGSVDGLGEPRWSSRPHYALAELSKELNVPYLNSYEVLKPLILGTHQSTYYYNGDMHFNPRGYAAWAEVQFQFLVSSANGLLPVEFLREIEANTALSSNLNSPEPALRR